MNHKIKIGGMHCVSCEIILAKEFEKLPGVTHCHVSHRKGRAVFTCEGDLPMDRIREIVSSHGYKILKDGEKAEPPPKKNNGEDYLEMLFIAVCLGILIFFLGELNVFRYLPDLTREAGVGIAFLLGLIASVSTCLALLGGIVMSFGAMVKTDGNGIGTFRARALPHIYFHVGRIASYILLGGLLGALGSKISVSLSFTGVITVLVSVVMFYIALQILSIVPSITKFGFHLPKFLSGGIHRLQESGHHLAPLLIGALTFFLPCGFTQSAQLSAIASGTFLSGALIMGAFALGTMPVLLSVGVGSTYAEKGKAGFLHRLVGVIVLFFALYSFNAGLTLAGSPVTLDFWSGNGTTATESGGAPSVQAQQGVQIVKMDVDWTFIPSEFTVKKGVPVRFEINGINVSGCASSIVIPKYNIFEYLKPGLNVVEFTPEETGVIPFSCGMGMIRGRFNVE